MQVTEVFKRVMKNKIYCLYITGILNTQKDTYLSKNNLTHTCQTCGNTILFLKQTMNAMLSITCNHMLHESCVFKMKIN